MTFYTDNVFRSQTIIDVTNNNTWLQDNNINVLKGKLHINIITCTTREGKRVVN